MITNLFCCFGVPRELHSNHCCTFEFWLMHEVLQRLEMNKTHTPHSSTAVVWHGGTIHQTGWEASAKGRRVASEGLGCEITHLLPYLQGIHPRQHGCNTIQPSVRKKVRLPCDLVFAKPPDKKRPTIDHAEMFANHLHDILNYARQSLKLACGRIKTRCDRLSNSAGYRRATKCNNIAQPAWRGSCPCSNLHKRAWINFVVYGIQRNSNTKLTVVHLDRLAPYQGIARDKWP
jgi:hypothetical protein